MATDINSMKSGMFNGKLKDCLPYSKFETEASKSRGHAPFVLTVK